MFEIKKNVTLFKTEVNFLKVEIQDYIEEPLIQIPTISKEFSALELVIVIEQQYKKRVLYIHRRENDKNCFDIQFKYYINDVLSSLSWNLGYSSNIGSSLLSLIIQQLAQIPTDKDYIDILRDFSNDIGLYLYDGRISLSHIMGDLKNKVK